MKNIKGCLSHKSDIWSTPSKLYERFMIKGYYDPCPLNPSFDGLSTPWKNKNFVNPPYSEINKWIDKAIMEMCRGNLTIMLIPSRTDTKWFKKLVDTENVHIIFLEGRLKFNDYKCAPFPSMFVYFGDVSRDLDYYTFSSHKFSYLCKTRYNHQYLGV